MYKLLEKLERVKEISESINEAFEDLSTVFDEINEATADTEIPFHIREAIVKLVTTHDPVLEQGTPVRDSVDLIIEAMPEEIEEEIEDNDFNDY